MRYPMPYPPPHKQGGVSLEQPTKKVRKPPRLTRRAWLTAALCGAVLLAIAFVLLLPTIKARFPAQTGGNLEAKLTFRTLSTGEKNTLDTITVYHTAGNEQYTLQYRNEKLYLLGESGEPQLVNESYTDEIVRAATEIAVEDTVSDDATELTDYLDDMGLEPPAITAAVRYADGHVETVSLGAQVPGTTYHYYRWSGAAGVYMCDVGIYEAFEYSAKMLLPVEQPTLAATLIDRLTLRTQTAERIDVAFTNAGANTYLGTLREPYHYPMDSAATQTLLSAIQNFRLGTKLSDATPELSAEYGFDHPAAVLDIHQQEGLYTQIDAAGVLQTLTAPEQTLRFTFGKKDGEYFYFCEYAGECYRVSSFLVSPFVNADPETYLTRAPADMGSASIASIAVQLGDGALDVRAVYTERVQQNNQIQTDSQGNTVYDVSVTVNGIAITADAFTSLVERLAQMTVSGRLESAEMPTGTPRWQMTLTTTGGATRTLAAYPLDAFSDVLVVDGVALHYMNAEAIQIALAELYPTARATTPNVG